MLSLGPADFLSSYRLHSSSAREQALFSSFAFRFSSTALHASQSHFSTSMLQANSRSTALRSSCLPKRMLGSGNFLGVRPRLLGASTTSKALTMPSLLTPLTQYTSQIHQRVANRQSSYNLRNVKLLTFDRSYVQVLLKGQFVRSIDSWQS